MNQFKFTSAKLTQEYKSDHCTLTIEVHKESTFAVKEMIDDLQSDTVYLAKVTQFKTKRTLDQNAYLWVLCQRIAEVIKSTKEEVYRGFIKEVGQFDILCIQDKAVERFIRNWNDKGIGWFCETDTSKIKKCKNVIAYYGTSVYDKSEMSRVIDMITEECKELKISLIVQGYEE